MNKIYLIMQTTRTPKGAMAAVDAFMAFDSMERAQKYLNDTLQLFRGMDRAINTERNEQGELVSFTTIGLYDFTTKYTIKEIIKGE